MSYPVTLTWLQWNIFGRLVVEDKKVFLHLSRAEVDGSPRDIPLANLRPIPLTPYDQAEATAIVSAHTTGPKVLRAAIINSLAQGKRYEQLVAQAMGASNSRE